MPNNLTVNLDLKSCLKLPTFAFLILSTTKSSHSDLL